VNQRPLRWVILPAIIAALIAASSPAASARPSSVDVHHFGAKGNGKHDDTSAFQRAMKAVSAHGGIVFVPVGRYLIASHLVVPEGVTLEGVWTAPPAYLTTGRPAYPDRGSVLLAVEGAGNETGPAFITLDRGSTLKGLTVFYPNQRPDALTPYPWCVQGAGGDNISIVNCMLVNPYQAVDFGTHSCSRHYVKGLYGQPLRTGLFVDQCYDIGRIEDVHFWPFWSNDPKVRAWMVANGEAFVFARTDWEYVLNTFCIGYKIAYHFIQSKHGTMNGNLVGIGADTSHNAVEVDASHGMGILITNGEFVSDAGEQPTSVAVSPTNKGDIRFVNCSFWGPAYQIANLAGGMVTFSACNFVNWAFITRTHHGTNVPAITLSGGNLIVTGCTFRDRSAQLALEAGAGSAIFTSNFLASPLSIQNPSHVPVQVGLNVSPQAR